MLKSLLHTGKIRTVQPGMITQKCMNTSVSIVDVNEQGSGVLVKYSDVQHLAGLKETSLEDNADVISAA
jgi:2,3-bisphosphoglycerate-dependent phosphoglycerate mutase